SKFNTARGRCRRRQSIDGGVWKLQPIKTATSLLRHTLATPVMTTRPHVLLASPSGAHERLAQSLLSAGYEITVVGDFATAKAYLDKRPDLLVTEVKLGAY